MRCQAGLGGWEVGRLGLGRRRLGYAMDKDKKACVFVSLCVCVCLRGIVVDVVVIYGVRVRAMRCKQTSNQTDQLNKQSKDK